MTKDAMEWGMDPVLGISMDGVRFRVKYPEVAFTGKTWSGFSATRSTPRKTPGTRCRERLDKPESQKEGT